MNKKRDSVNSRKESSFHYENKEKEGKDKGDTNENGLLSFNAYTLTSKNLNKNVKEMNDKIYNEILIKDETDKSQNEKEKEEEVSIGMSTKKMDFFNKFFGKTSKNEFKNSVQKNVKRVCSSTREINKSMIVVNNNKKYVEKIKDVNSIFNNHSKCIYIYLYMYLYIYVLDLNLNKLTRKTYIMYVESSLRSKNNK